MFTLLKVIKELSPLINDMCACESNSRHRWTRGCAVLVSSEEDTSYRIFSTECEEETYSPAVVTQILNKAREQLVTLSGQEEGKGDPIISLVFYGFQGDTPVFFEVESEADMNIPCDLHIAPLMLPLPPLSEASTKVLEVPDAVMSAMQITLASPKLLSFKRLLALLYFQVCVFSLHRLSARFYYAAISY
jgi:hypothetical protein